MNNIEKLEIKASNYGTLGDAKYRGGDLNGAEEMYKKSLEIDKKLALIAGV